MRRAEGQERLLAVGAIDGPSDDAVRAYAALARELEVAVAQARKDKSWQLEGAEALAGLLLAAVDARLHAEVSAPTRSLLGQALTEGPDALKRLAESLGERLGEALAPEERLAALRARRTCLELRLRCLDDLAVVFDSRRSQP